MIRTSVSRTPITKAEHFKPSQSSAPSSAAIALGNALTRPGSRRRSPAQRHAELEPSHAKQAKINRIRRLDLDIRQSSRPYLHDGLQFNVTRPVTLAWTGQSLPGFRRSLACPTGSSVPVGAIMLLLIRPSPAAALSEGRSWSTSATTRVARGNDAGRSVGAAGSYEHRRLPLRGAILGQAIELVTDPAKAGPQRATDALEGGPCTLPRW